jgi:hypothetical protein
VIDKSESERNLHDIQNRPQDLQEHAQEALDMAGQEHDDQLRQHDRQQDDADEEPTLKVRSKGEEYDHGSDAVGRHDRRQPSGVIAMFNEGTATSSPLNDAGVNC